MQLCKLMIGLLLLTSGPVQAHYSTMDTGDILPQGRSNLGGELQFITDGDSGANLIGRWDTGVSEDSNVRAEIGFGSVDFSAGAFYKWIPIPDYDNQPAMGLIGGVIYARNEGFDELSLRLTPIASKNFKADFGEFTPYVSVPMGFRTLNSKGEDETDFPVQLTLGSRLRTHHYKNLVYFAELGFDLNEAFTYLSLGATIEIDEEDGLIIWQGD